MDHAELGLIATLPPISVFRYGETISFLCVAGGMREYEVVAQVEWIANPGDEVINMGVSQSPTTVEAAILIVVEYGTVFDQWCAFAPEQEFIKIGNLTQPWLIGGDASYVADPSSLHKILNLSVKLTEHIGDATHEYYIGTGWMFVQERYYLAANILKLVQRHISYNVGNTRDQSRPFVTLHRLM
jgi:hypothetical protein|tara:strand:- start:27 stop:581 length:555 start_codon:yes stop_codon:yes gene_type:complete